MLFTHVSGPGIPNMGVVSPYNYFSVLRLSMPCYTEVTRKSRQNSRKMVIPTAPLDHAYESNHDKRLTEGSR